MSRPHLPWCALADDHEGMCNDEPLRSRATHDASTDPVPRLEPVVMGQRYSNDWGPLEPALDPERIHMQAKAQRALESIPPLETWKTGARATSLREYMERAKALGDVFEAFTLEAKEQAVAAGLAFIAKRDAAWAIDAIARASASCWQREAALGTTEGCMTCSAKRREDNPEEVR